MPDELTPAPPCLLMRITLRSTEVFEQLHPLPPDLADPETWGPVHEEAYGRTFDELVRQGHRHDPNVAPAFAIVPCPADLRRPHIHAGWTTSPQPSD
jgi:hypothetical protein